MAELTGLRPIRNVARSRRIRPEATVRLFVGVALPASLRQTLADRYGGLDGARWVAPENLHLTLRFVGEVSNPVADEVDLALAAISAGPARLSLSGVGAFERSGRPTVLWTGVERDGALDHLRAKVDGALRRAGLPPERRRFSPHVTLARVEQVAPPLLAAWMQAHNLLRAGPCAVDHFTLFSSHRGDEQAVYVPEVDYALDGTLAAERR